MSKVGEDAADLAPAWPDWKCERDYAATASMSQWAWEFLRRNAEYGADFSRARSEFDGLGQDEWAIGTRKIAAKWGTEWLQDPAEPEAGPFFWLKSTGVVRQVRIGDPSVDSLKPTFQFDLEQPLPPQIERVKRLLGSRQDRMAMAIDGRVNRAAIHRRARHGEYRNYLRVLDALQAWDCSGSEIVPVETLRKIVDDLFPNGELFPAKLKDWIDAARLLRDRDYRILPTLETLEK